MDSYRNINERTKERTRNTGQGVRKRSARFVSAILALSMVMSLFVMPQITPTTAEAAPTYKMLYPTSDTVRLLPGAYQLKSGTYDHGISFESGQYGSTLYVAAGDVVTINDSIEFRDAISYRNYLQVDGILNINVPASAAGITTIYNRGNINIFGTGTINITHTGSVSSSMGSGAGIGSGGSSGAAGCPSIFIADNITINAKCAAGGSALGSTGQGYGIGSGGGSEYGTNTIQISKHAKLGTTTVQPNATYVSAMSVTPASAPTEKPQNVSIQSTSSGWKISWDKITGAQCYRIYIGDREFHADTQNYETISKEISTGSLDGGTKYGVRVAAVDAGGVGPASDVIESPYTLCDNLDKSKMSYEIVGNNQVKITWAPVTGASKYKLSWYDSDDESNADETTNCQYTITNQVYVDKVFQVKVEPVNLDGVVTQASNYYYTNQIMALARAISYSDKTMTEATCGSNYNQNVGNASGGSSSYKYELSSGSLPAGLRLATNGNLTGTPTAAGTYSFEVKATDNTYTACSDTATVTVNINPSAPSAPTGLSFVRTGSGTGTVSFKGSTSDGDGKGLDKVNYQVEYSTSSDFSNSRKTTATTSGSTAAGASVSIPVSGLSDYTSYYFRVIAVSSSDSTKTATSDYIAGGTYADITYNNKTIAATYGVSYTGDVKNTAGGSGSYKYEWVSGDSLSSLGLTLAQDGTLSGMPTAPAGTYSFTVKATDKIYTPSPSDTATITLTINATNPGAPTEVKTESGDKSVKLMWKAPNSDGDGKGGLSYKIDWGKYSNPTANTVTTEDLQYTFSGLENTAYYFTVTAINQSGKSASAKQVSESPYGEMRYTGGMISGYAVKGVNSTLTVPSPTGGSGKYTYTRIYGDLPNGMTLTSSGEITGTPRNSGVFEIDVYAEDEDGHGKSATITLGVVTKDTFNGAGTAADPYLIETEEDLWNFTIRSQASEFMGTYFKMTNDIVLNDGTITADSTDAVQWLPIGSRLEFRGYFDGDYHTISGLYIVDDAEHVGLFGRAWDANIHNVGLINSYIENKRMYRYAGGIVGYAGETAISGCYNEATVVAHYAAGIVGAIEGSSISNSYNKGLMGGNIPKAIAAASEDEYNLSIVNCYNAGTKIDGSSIEFTDYSSNVSGGEDSDYNSIANCYNIGSAHSDTLSKDWYKVYTRTAKEMKSPEFLTELGGNSGAWFMDVPDADGNYKNDGYPILKPSFNGEGTAQAPYEISNAAELQALSAAVNGGWHASDKYFVLTNDIDLNPGKTITAESKNDSSVVKWTPIGSGNSYETAFHGNFDGKGHTVSGLYCVVDGYAGLFGNYGGENRRLSGVGVINSYIESINNCAAGIVAHHDTYGVGTIYINQCYNEATVKGSIYSAGIIGDSVDSVNISNCYNKGTIIGSIACGIAGNTYNDEGDQDSTTMLNCYNIGILNGSIASYELFGGSTTDGDSVTGGSNESYPYLKNNYYLASSHTDDGGRTAEEMKAPEFVSELGADYWYMDTADENGNYKNDGYPLLERSFSKGSGTKEDPYLISTAEELIALSLDRFNWTLPNYFALDADIDLNPGKTITADSGNDSDIVKWSPMHLNENIEIDGRNHTISGIYCVNENGNAAFTEWGNGVTIKNLGIVNSYIKGKIAAGISVVSTDLGIDIINCYNEATIIGSEAAAGIALGSCDGININSCYNKGLIGGKDPKAIIHYTDLDQYDYSTIENCYNVGTNVDGSSLEFANYRSHDSEEGYVNVFRNNYQLGTEHKDCDSSAKVQVHTRTAEEMKSPEFINEIGNSYKFDKTALNDTYPIFADREQAKMPITVTFGDLTQDYDGNPKPVSVTVTNTLGYKVPITADEYTLTYNGSSDVPTADGKYEVEFALKEGNAFYTLADSAKAELKILVYKPGVPVVGDAVSQDSSVLIKSIEDTNVKVMDIDHFTVSACAPGTTTVVKTKEIGKKDIVDKKAENVVIDGLTNGSIYDIYITATNDIGTSDPYKIENVQVGLPTTPEDLSIRQMSGENFDISFKPSDGQGSKIIGYDLIIGGTIDTDPMKEITVPITENEYSSSNGYIVYTYSIADSGRKNGDTITVKAVAKSETANGVKMQSDPAGPAEIEMGAPTAPVLTGKVDKDGISLSWTKADTYLVTVGKYIVEIKDKNGKVDTFETANGSAREMRINTGDLSAANKTYPFVYGDNYIVTVKGNNGVNGLPSNEFEVSFGIAPQPDPPTIEPNPEDPDAIDVIWDKPEGEDENHRITGYNIYLNYNPRVKVTWNENGENDGKYQLYLTDLTNENAEPVAYGAPQDNLDHFVITISGLKKGVSYKADVTAINEIVPPAPTPGPNPTDDPNPPVLVDPPAAPTDVKAKAISDKSVQLNWRAPINNGGAPVSGYIVEAYKVSEIDYETFTYNNLSSPEPVKTYGSIENPNSDTSYTVNDLEEGFGYEFKIYSVNTAGKKSENGASSNEAKTFTKPSKPVITDVVSELGKSTPKITIKWNAPEHDGGTQIIGYDIMRGEKRVGKIRCDENNKTLPNELECDINPAAFGTRNGVLYTYTVIAYNAVTGEDSTKGVVSEPVSAVAGTVAPPEKVIITPDQEKVSFVVSWDLDQYKDIINYIDHFVVYITADGGTQEMPTANNTVNSKEFTSDYVSKEYTVEVAAVSRINTELKPGRRSAPEKVTIGAPKKVENVIATPGENNITVTWDAVAKNNNSNCDVTQYTVYFDGKEIDKIGDGITPVPDGTEMKISSNDPLVGGQEYAVTVAATNRYGTSTSDVVKATPYSKPDAPVVSNIKPADGGFGFTFADGNGNGTTIEDYKLYKYNEAASNYEQVTTNVTIDKDKKTVDVTGLNNTENLRFYLAAVGRVEVNGTKVELESKAPEGDYRVTVGAPMPPKNVRADAGEKSATISFDKPDGLSVDEYYIKQVVSSGEPITVDTIQVADKTKESYSRVINGLDNGNDYSYFVIAHNNNGGDSERSQVVTVKPGTPNAPTDVQVEEGNEELKVTWKASQPNVEYYTVYVDGNEYYPSTSKTSLTVSPLSNGTPYEITVKAYNKVGYSTPSIPVTGTPGGKPDPVSSVHAEKTYSESDSCGLVLTWDAPNGNGREIEEYKVTCDGVDNSNISVTMDETTKAGTAVIKKLALATEYKIDIIANNGADSDVFTTTQKTYSLPDAPVMRGATSNTENVINVKWIVPENTGGSDITEYTVYARKTTGDKEVSKIYKVEELPEPNSSNEISVTISDEKLEANEEYDVTVAAKTFAYGKESKTASWVIIATPSDNNRLPGPPANMKLRPGNHQVRVEWNYPTDDGGKTVTSFTVYAGSKPEEMGPIGKPVIVDPADPDFKTKTYSLTDNNDGKGLENGVTRYYKVYATNGVGNGEPCSVDSAEPTEKGVPSWGTEGAWPAFDNAKGVSAYEVDADWENMKITWNKAETNPAGGTVYYDVFVDGTKVLEKATDADRSYTFGNLIELHPYNIEVYAYNEDGAGEQSAPITAVNKLNVRKAEGYPYDPYYGVYGDGTIYANIDEYYEGRETRKAGKPTAPQNFVLTKNAADEAVATWTPPEDDGNRDIDHYNVYIDGTCVQSIGADELFEESLNVYSARSTEPKYGYRFKMDAGKVYSVYVTAVNTAPEEGDPTDPKDIGPVIKLEAEVSQDDIENINLTWTPVSGDNVKGYVLYGAGLPQDIAYEIGTDGKAHSTLEGVINNKYALAVAVKYTNDMIVSMSNTETVETGTIDAPTITSAEGAETDPYIVTVTWDAPANAANVDLKGYLIYVNGEKREDVGIIDKDTTSKAIQVDSSCSIRVVGVCEHYDGTSNTGIGTMSEPKTYTISDNADSTIIIPDITDYSVNRNTDGMVVDDENGNNVTITWNAGEADAQHIVPATDYNIYAGGLAVGSVHVNEGDTTFTYSFHVEPGREYNVTVTPVANGTSGESDSITVPVLHEFAAPNKPVLEVTINNEKTIATTYWTEEAGVRYELWVNGERYSDDWHDADEYPLKDNESIYRFMIKAVKSYDGEDKLTDSDVVTKDLSTYLSNPPVITGTLSSSTETKTKIFWTAPTDKLRYEVGDIEEYGVIDVNSGEVLGTVSADDNSNGVYVFEIDTFANAKDSKTIAVRAYKNIDQTMQVSATSETWTATPYCNIVKNEDDYNNNNISAFPDSVDGLDANRNGVPDDEENRDNIEIPITINVDGAVADVVEIGADGKPLPNKTWDSVEIKDGKVVLEALTDDLSGKTFNFVVRKPGHTSYTITNVPYADLPNVGSKLTDVVLWVGDVDGDGDVSKSDVSILQNNVGQEATPELKMFDTDNDGEISKSDVSTIQNNVGNGSSLLIWVN